MSGGAHAVFVPWSGYGHLVPMLLLAEFLASHESIRVTIAYTARTHSRLQAVSSLSLSNIITEIIEDGLNPDPAYTPSYDDITRSIITMQQSLEKLLEHLTSGPHPVTCLISGTLCPWTIAAAQKFSIPRVELWASPAFIYCLGFYHRILMSEGLCPFKGSFEDTWIKCIPGVTPLRASDFPKEFLLPKEEISDPERFTQAVKSIHSYFVNAREQYKVLVNSIYDIESSAFDALQADGVQIYAVGPLFLQKRGSKEVFEQQHRTSMCKEDVTCLQWLDGKADLSTIYVAFGSDTKMSKETIQELAFGLEECGHHFLWVIRQGSVLGCQEILDEALPEGFRERVVGRGLIVSWAPQLLVLAHPSVGAFLSHCGWNSALETFYSGVPIIAWPQRADQSTNRKFIEEEWKVGLSIKKDGDGKVTRSTIGKAISQIMQGEEGCMIRQNVKAMKELLVKAMQMGAIPETI